MAAPSPVALPRLREADPNAVLRWAEDIVTAIDRELTALRTAAGQTSYSLTNLTQSRALDCTGATLAQLLAVVGTLITDCKTKGVVA